MVSGLICESFGREWRNASPADATLVGRLILPWKPFRCSHQPKHLEVPLAFAIVEGGKERSVEARGFGASRFVLQYAT